MQLREEWRGILNPQPLYVGIGINDILEEHLEADLLTLLLWRLLEHTTWSFGVGESMDLLLANASDAAATYGPLLLAQEPLPPGTTMQEVCAVLARWQPAPALGPLLAYAVGQTGNVFADASMYDLYAGYDGMDLWEWSDAAFIAQEQQAAMQIALAYTAWSRVVDQAPDLRIPEIAALLHAAARGRISRQPPELPWGRLDGALRSISRVAPPEPCRYLMALRYTLHAPDHDPPWNRRRPFCGAEAVRPLRYRYALVRRGYLWCDSSAVTVGGSHSAMLPCGRSSGTTIVAITSACTRSTGCATTSPTFGHATLRIRW